MQRNLIFTRNANDPLPPVTVPQGFDIHLITRAGADAFRKLDELCTSNGFPDGWVGKMLEGGARAIFVTQNQAPAATGWLTRTPFYVDEIHRTFDPGPRGEYYFGDFIAPEFRGQRLHRLVIHHRLLLSREAGLAPAALTCDTNLPSVKGYQSMGFRATAAIHSFFVGRWRLDRMRELDESNALTHVSREGCRIPLIGLIRRR